MASLRVSSLLDRKRLMCCQTATVCPSRPDSGLPMVRREKGEVERRRELLGAYLCPSHRSCFEFQVVRVVGAFSSSHLVLVQEAGAWWAVSPSTLPGSAEQIPKASPLTGISPGILLPPSLLLGAVAPSCAPCWQLVAGEGPCSDPCVLNLMSFNMQHSEPGLDL